MDRQALVRAVGSLALLILVATMLSQQGCNRGEEGDNIDPYIRIVFPPEDTNVLNDIATIRVDARDNVGIKHVIFMAKGDTLSRVTIEPYTFYWNTTAYQDCTDANSYVLFTAIAEDFAGNSRSTQRQFYLDNEGLPPIPVEFLESTGVTKHTGTLSWEKSLDYDFSHYVLYRDTTTEVTIDSDTIVTLVDPNQTSYTDAGDGVSPFGLLEDTEYNYRIYIHDVFGRSTGSDSTVSFRTLLPQPIRVRAAASITKYTAGLRWDASSEDVAYYRLHRGFSPLETALDSIAGFPQGTVTYTDSGLTANTTYYYYLFLIDEAGYTHHFRDDDVLLLQTAMIPAPIIFEPATNITKYQATVNWDAIEIQEDASWVGLHRGIAEPIDSTDVQLYTGPINEVPNFTDISLRQGQSYYYGLHHWDTQNNTAWSNTLQVTTQSLGDIWRGGFGVSSVDKYELDLTWDQYSYAYASDFVSYTLSRDGVVITTILDASNNQYNDTGLEKNRSYAYRVGVTDTSGATIEATLDASTREIFPAEIIDVEPTEDWYYRLYWLPSQEPDTEFNHYELLRSPDPNVDYSDGNGDNLADCLAGSDCIQVTTLSQREPASGDTIKFLDADTTLVDTATTTLPIYNYVVLTYDEAGEYVRSNIVGDTLYSSPTPVQLQGPAEHGAVTQTSIRLEWNQATWPSPGLATLLFSGYEIWRNATGGQTPEAQGSTYQKIGTITDLSLATYSDSNVERGAFWHYIIIVRDIYGQAALSNEVEGYTSP
jgi:hypothetical protein